MKVLHLTLKKKWFDMIASGEKLEEYREMSDYWFKRLASCKIESDSILPDFQEYDYVHFFQGWCFSQKLPNFKVKVEKISVGEGNSEWGAEPGKKYFVIKLGKIIS